MHDDQSPLYWTVRAELASRPAPGGRHRWHGAPQSVPTGARRRHAIDTPTEAIPVTNPVNTEDEVVALMPPDIPEDEMTVAVCGSEED